ARRRQSAPASPISDGGAALPGDASSASRPAKCATARAIGDALARKDCISAFGSDTSLKTSRPYMTSGTPLLRVMAAASGSCQKLNSATAVALPTDADPPMKRIFSIFLHTWG